MKNNISLLKKLFISASTDSISQKMDMYNNIKLSHKKIISLSNEAQDYANTHGIVMRKPKQNVTHFAPFMLFPTPFPQHLYEEAMTVQKDFQELVHKASLDHEFIKSSLKSVIIHDEFTRNQYQIYEEAREQGCKPKYYFNMTRSDYMIDKISTEVSNQPNGPIENRPYEIKQIEINMIAASFGGLNTKVCDMHRFLPGIIGDESPYSADKVPPNTSLKKMGEGLALAWKQYGVERAVVVMVVLDGETNSYDQRHLEYSFYENIKELGVKEHVPLWFRSMKYAKNHGHLTEDKRFILDNREVALFYFRASYSPDDFPTQEYWDGRLMMEHSIAIKCPTMAGSLIGTKKVQQIFALPNTVEKFIEDKDAIKRMRRTFAGLYSLDPGPEGDSAKQMALDNPARYVLKPQREGGGNNMYDEELVHELKRLSDPIERSQYILMERIMPPIVKNYIVHVDFEEPMLAATITELGVFGFMLSDENGTITNQVAGHLLRTKDIQHKDGGVAAGRAVLDSPYLI